MVLLSWKKFFIFSPFLLQEALPGPLSSLATSRMGVSVSSLGTV